MFAEKESLSTEDLDDSGIVAVVVVDFADQGFFLKSVTIVRTIERLAVHLESVVKSELPKLSFVLVLDFEKRALLLKKSLLLGAESNEKT